MLFIKQGNVQNIDEKAQNKMVGYKQSEAPNDYMFCTEQGSKWLYVLCEAPNSWVFYTE